MELEPLVSIVLPVYNRSSYLKTAIESVFKQTYSHWELIIADDASNEETQLYLNQYVGKKNTKVIFNSANLGLFSNLNQAIRKSSGAYILLLCSDDILLENCLEDSVHLLNRYPLLDLLLSSYEVTNEYGDVQTDTNISKVLYHNWLKEQSSRIFRSEEILPLLLKYGSINGNLTGMFFSRDLFNEVGGFTEKWRQVSDWEWVYRAIKEGNIVLSQVSRTIIRNHSEQLSGVNLKSFRNSLEVVEMTNILLQDPYISSLKESKKWANHMMQLHLWYALKGVLAGKGLSALKLSQEIHRTVGLHHTFWAMLKWLPQRWEIYWHKQLPPYDKEEKWNSIENQVINL